MDKTESVSIFAQLGQYSWCIALASLCLVFIGWRVTYNNAIRLATRSESKSIIDSISKLVIELTDLSVDFWLNKSSSIEDSLDDKSKEIVILNKKNQSTGFLFNVLAKNKQIYKLIDILSLRGICLSPELLSIAHEKITLDCETSYLFSVDERTERTQEIISVCMEVIEKIHENFQKYHPPSKPETFLQMLHRKNHEIDQWYNSLNKGH